MTSEKELLVLKSINQDKNTYKLFELGLSYLEIAQICSNFLNNGFLDKRKYGFVITKKGEKELKRANKILKFYIGSYEKYKTNPGEINSITYLPKKKKP